MATRKILSSDGRAIFAIAVSDKTIEIKRRDQKFTITGNDFSVVGTSRNSNKATMLIVKEGKIDDTQVKFAKDEDVDEETGDLKENKDDDKDENDKSKKSDKKDDKDEE